MNSDLLHGFYLADLFIEPLKGQVTTRVGSKHLPPKAIEVLLCLAAKPGELVTRDTLLDEVWGAGHGSQEALGHAVSEIRHAFDDRAENPTFIQTLPKRGYRLVIKPKLTREHSSTIVLGASNSIVPDEIGLFENLKRRGVFETALAYMIVGWLLIQVADIVFGQLHLPAWTGTFATVLVIAGFPIAIVLSWFLEFRDGKAVIHELSPADARRRRFSRTYTSVLSALCTAAVLVFFYDQFVGLPKAVTTTVQTSITTVELPIADNSIAVLPFLNNDGSGETQTFASGLADDVITRLSRVPGLLVSARGDSHTLAPNAPSNKVRQRLRVAMYIEGSVEIAGDTLRVIVQIIDSSNGFHILSRTFDRPRNDYFQIRDEITDLTVSSLRVALPESTQALSVSASSDPSLDVYVLYRHGIEILRQPHTNDTVDEALDRFDAALNIDPEYAAAHAGRCDALISRYLGTNDVSSIADAESACARALQLNPNLVVVHTALGDLYRHTGRYDESARANEEALSIHPNNVAAILGLSEAQHLLNDPIAAETTLRQAIGLQPGNWRVFNSLGHFLFRQGRFVEATEQFQHVITIDDRNMQGLSNLAASYMLAGNFESAKPVYARAIEIEPRTTTFINLGLMQYYLGEYENAAASMRAAIEKSPNSHYGWMNLGDILHADQQLAESQRAFGRAKELVEAALEVNPNEATLLMDLAWPQAVLGAHDEALQTIYKAQIAAPDDPYAWYIEALVQNEGGASEAAISALRIAVEKGYARFMIAAEPHLKNLRNDPGFEAIVIADEL